MPRLAFQLFVIDKLALIIGNLRFKLADTVAICARRDKASLKAVELVYKIRGGLLERRNTNDVTFETGVVPSAAEAAAAMAASNTSAIASSILKAVLLKISSYRTPVTVKICGRKTIPPAFLSVVILFGGNAQSVALKADAAAVNNAVKRIFRNVDGDFVSMEMSLSSPLNNAPPPVSIMPRSIISAESSGGVFSRVERTASRI